MAIAMFLLAVALVGAAGVYAYGAYLKTVKESKAARLSDAERGIASDAVEEFVRSRDRFLLSEALLESHVATSGFFDLLERITLASVRYSNLSLTRLADGSAEIELSGAARSFNALAAQSAAFSSEKLVKRAVFSDIALAENGNVSFSLSAEADPRLFTFTVDGAATAPAAPTPMAPAATTTAPSVPKAPAAPVATTTGTTATTTAP